MFDNILNKYFSGLGVALSKSFCRYVNGIISSGSFSTHEIARHVSKNTGYSFNTSDKGLSYLLSNNNLQIDDAYWRQHINMVFDLMLEQNLIKKRDKIYIQVDFTSSNNDFLILCASVVIGNRSVPLYFTMRKYPKRAGMYDHKKMERAFFKGLQHVLSKQYSYVLVMDRGFGNNRILDICEELEFDYLIRITPNMIVENDGKRFLARDYCNADGCYDAKIERWQKEVRIIKSSNGVGAWHLVSNVKDIKENEAVLIYKDRFKIEKCFQDLKSSGFDIEQTKIRKYDRYKRLLAMTMLSHVLLVMLGYVISVKLPSFLKNFTLMEESILAYLQLEKNPTPYCQNSRLERLLISS